MRRALCSLSLSLVLLVLTALPALAAGEPEFTGTFQGLAYAGIAGVVLGIVYFLSLPAGPADDHDGHDAHH